MIRVRSALLVGAAISALVHAVPAWGQEPRLVGCWTLQVGDWEPSLASHDPGFPPPAWFELRGRRGGGEGPAIYGGRWSSRERHWKWSRLRGGGVAIVFSRGFAGYHLRLQPPGEQPTAPILEGTIEAFSDVRGRSRATATATRAACPIGGR